MKFVLKSKTNKDKSTEILFPSSLNQLIYICARAMSRARKGQQKVPIFKGTVQRDFHPPFLFIIRICLGH